KPLGSTGRSLIRSAGIPRVRARFGLVSPSIARTLWPSRAISRASVPEIEVLPEPPFPAIASFIAPPPLDAVSSHRGYRRLCGCRTGAAESSDEGGEAVHRPWIVAGDEVVDVGQGRAHADGEWLHVEVRRPRVDPDQPPRLQLDPARLPREQPGVS